jgi:glycosyltransferase involved in cell wall biosynthesis
LNQIGISAVINTLNEECNIRNAILSVRDWVNEVLVVDMHSDDKTVEIAESLGARVMMHERIIQFDKARDFAIRNASCEWILLLDADEQISQKLSKIILNIVKKAEYDVAMLPRLNFMFGAPVRFTGWGPDQDAQYKLFKKKVVRVTGRIHDFLAFENQSRIVKVPYSNNTCIYHYNFLDLEHHWRKINNYSTIEAIEKYEARSKISVLSFTLLPIKEFLKRYIYFKGYRDGWRGVLLSTNLALCQMLVCMKLLELYKVGKRADVVNIYALQALQVIKEYERDAPR